MLSLLLTIIMRVFNVEELHILKSLEVNCSNASCTLFMGQIFLINNVNVIVNSVEKYCFALLNVKLQVKIRIKTFNWLLKLLHINWTINTVLLEIFAYPSNKRVIYGPVLNL